MIVDIIPVICVLTGGLTGAYLTMYPMRKTLEAERRRADDQNKRADEAARQKDDAQRELRTATAVERDLRVQCATLQGSLVGQTERADRAEVDLVAAREELAHERGMRQAETRRADDSARDLLEAQRKLNELTRDLSASREELKAANSSLKHVECLLAEKRTLYEMAENAARHHRGEHAYHQSMSESRLVRINLLEAHILNLRDRLRAAETRAAQREIMERIVELAKLTLAGHSLPALPARS
jgi:chromosome segregation ATPase